MPNTDQDARSADRTAAPGESMPRSIRRAAVILLPILSLSLTALLGEGVLRLLGYGNAIRFEYVSQLGWVHEPNRHASTLGRPVRINEHGLRGGPLAPRKPRNGYRLMVIGDSFTFGYGVDEDSTYGAALERAVARQLPCRSVELINGGVNGYNTRQEADLLRLIGVPLQPDLVVVGLTPNDIMAAPEARTMLRHPRLKRLISRSALYQFFAPRLKAVLMPGERKSYTAALDHLMGAPDRDAEQRWRGVSGALRDIQSQGAEHGFRTVVAVFPLDVQVYQGRASWLEQRVRALGARDGMDVVDLYPAYRAAYERGANLFLDEPTHHPDPLGHAVAAAELAGYLARSGILPTCGTIQLSSGTGPEHAGS
jgi:hypothetical protein